MKDDLYSGILEALASAKALGRLEERMTANPKADLVSERKATDMFGSRAVRRYQEVYGTPERTGGKANSKRLYSITRLAELVEAERIEAKVVTFESDIRLRQRRESQARVTTYLDGKYVPLEAL